MTRDCPGCEHPLYWHNDDGCYWHTPLDGGRIRICPCRRTRDGDPTA